MPRKQDQIGRLNLRLLKKKGLLIDKEDEHLVINSPYTWVIGGGYIQYSSYREGTIVRLHTLILPNDDPALEVDHINVNRLDNRKSNLRLVSHRDNVSNLKKVRDLPVGVSYLERLNKYQAQIGIKRNLKYLGVFETPEEASKAYQKAKADLVNA